MTQAPGAGGVWTKVSTLGGGGGCPIGLSVVRDPSHPNTPIVLAAVQGSGIWRKVGGNSWSKASGFTTAGTDLPQSAQFARRSGFHKVYVYDRTSALWRGSDFGATWVRIAAQTSASNGSGYVAAVPGNENQVVLSTPGGVKLVTNAGSAPTDGGTGPDLGLPSGRAGAIAVSARRLYAANTISGIWAITLTGTGVTGGWTPLDDTTWRNMIDGPAELAADANGSVYPATSGGALVLDGGG